PSRGKAGPSSKLLIAGVLRDHPLRGNGMEVELGRHVAGADPKNPPTYLIFFDIDKGQFDSFRGLVAGPALVRYLRGLLALNAPDEVKRLRYCFDFLEHPNGDIAKDAFVELSRGDEGNLLKACRACGAARLRACLLHPRTPA